MLTKEDLKDLGAVLESSTFIDDSALTHSRSDNITHFYYYRATLLGREIRLNVAKEERVRTNGRRIIKYFLYSINERNE